MSYTERVTPAEQPVVPDMPWQATFLAAVSTLNYPDSEAVLMVDSTGRIASCSQDAKDLLGGDEAPLEGRLITELIPELPFTPNTPGYNLAFSIFSEAKGGWTRRIALLANGQKMAIDTALSSVKIRYRRHIKLRLSPILSSH
jgi:hypothetical protein